MATIRTFVKGLLAGRPPAKPASPAAEPTHKVRGWVRIDSDNVMRGWAWDELDPGRRQTVRLFIDDKAENVEAARRVGMQAEVIDLRGREPGTLHGLNAVLERV